MNTINIKFNVLDVTGINPAVIAANSTEIPIFVPDVLSYNDYYPFGMLVPNRNYQSPSYRYGYQGSEKDDEVKGEGNSYTTLFRQLDVRLGKWLSIDPKGTAFESPYNSMSNNPIWFNDKLGDTIKAKFRDGFLGIFGKKHILKYAEKKGVWLENNKVYNGKLPKFYKQGLKDLNKLYSDKDGKKYIDYLQKRKQDLFLTFDTNNMNNTSDYSHLKYSGNPVEFEKENQGSKKLFLPSYIVLGHELVHKLSSALKRKNPLWYTADDGYKVGYDETIATHFENQLRARADLPLREYYIGGIEATRLLKKGTTISEYAHGGTYDYNVDYQMYKKKKAVNEIIEYFDSLSKLRLLEGF